MDLNIDLEQAGMSRGEFRKAGSPCWQQTLPCQGTEQGFGRHVLGSSLDCFPLQEQLFQIYLDSAHSERGVCGGFFVCLFVFVDIRPQERLISDVCFHFMPGVSRP